MAKKEEIEITISPDGTIHGHTMGIKGKECMEVVKRLAKEVGTVESKRFTSEYYEEEETAKVRRTL
ncbi:MAG: DUF2997 domain-containing protein [Chloroflexi bacterium]|nr:DUF2997 domain-containing protein [Chloroflexota bacterium]